MSQTRPPRYQHDCDKCTYLGQFEDQEQSEIYDLYWCKNPQEPILDSVIARYGNDGHEYRSSHPPGAFSGLCTGALCYQEALKRAEKAGFYDPKIAGTHFKVVVNVKTVYYKRGFEKEAADVFEKEAEKNKNDPNLF